MRDYELTVLVRPDLDEKSLDKEVKTLQTILEKAGAKTTKKTDALKRVLAYAISHLREAYYLYFEIEAKPEAVGEVETKIKFDENIVRYLIVRKEYTSQK